MEYGKNWKKMSEIGAYSHHGLYIISGPVTTKGLSKHIGKKRCHIFTSNFTRSTMKKEKPE